MQFGSKTLRACILAAITLMIMAACATDDDAPEREDPSGNGNGQPAIDRDDIPDSPDEMTEVGEPLAMLHEILDAGEDEFIRPVILGLDSPDYQDDDGNTALLIAAGHGSNEAAELALSEGADPDLHRDDGIAPIHVAVAEGYSDIVETLVEAGASVNASTDNGITPLHLAVEEEADGIVRLLLAEGADPFAERGDGKRPFDTRNELAADYRDRIAEAADEYSPAIVEPLLRHGDEVERHADDIVDYMDRYDTGVLEAYEAHGMDAFAVEEPELPPSAEAEVEVPREFDYVEQPYVEITVENDGRGGKLFEVVATVTVDGAEEQEVFFGAIDDGDSATRTVELPEPGLSDIGTDVNVEASFREANGYAATEREATVSIAEMNNRRVQEDIDRFTTENVRDLAAAEHIDRQAIDRLIHFEEIEYTIDDVIFFAAEREISQDLVETIVADEKVSYENSDLIELAEHNYLTRSIVESLFLEGREFSREEIETLVELDVFTDPEMLWTYTVDARTDDGILRPDEAPDFDVRMRNDTVFDLEDVSIRVEADHPEVELFDSDHSIDRIAGGETEELTTVVSLLPSFEGDAFELEVIAENDQFGELLVDSVEVPVGDEVEDDPVIALSKEVVSTEPVEVYDGASSDMSTVASFDSGAHFEVTGEMDDYYRVALGEQTGWVEQDVVADHTPEDDEEDYELASDLSEEDEFFEDQRPEVVIKSPENNERIDHNEVTVNVEAIGRQYGIESIAVWVNGELLPGSDGERGLAVAPDEDATGRERVSESYDIRLEEGDNDIRVEAYNSQNVASYEEEITVESTGMRNPPRLFMVSAGVDDYNDPDWDLRYAAKDAETMADIFETQTDLYEEIHTEVLLNEEATRGNIIDEIQSIVGRARPHDVVVVFLAGHGIQQRDTYYFLGADADPEQPGVDGLDQDTVQRELRYNVDTEKALVMLDTCQSGFVPGYRDAGPDMTEVVEDLAEARGLAFLSASRGNEAAREDPEWGHGAFTLAMREALEEGRAVGDAQRGTVTVTDLYDYVFDRVHELTDAQQRPKLSGSTEPFDLFAVDE